MEKTFGVSQFIPPPPSAPDSESFLTLYFLLQLLYSFHGLHSGPGCHLWGMVLGALSSFSSAKRDIAAAPS